MKKYRALLCPGNAEIIILLREWFSARGHLRADGALSIPYFDTDKVRRTQFLNQNVEENERKRVTMSNVLKRSLSLLLAFVMLVGMVPVGVLAEEVEEVSEEVVEEVYEEVAEEAEEEVYEDVYEEAEEEVVEEVVEEVEEEATLPALVGVVKDNVSNAAVAVDEAAAAVEPDGVLWLDKNRENDLLTAVMMGEMRDMILKAALREDQINDKVKVYYNGLDVGNIDMVSIMLDQNKKDILFGLKDKVTAYEDVTYTIKGGNLDQTVVIASRTYEPMDIVATNAVIESVGKPADLTASVEGMKNGSSFRIMWNGQDWTDLSLRKVLIEESTDYAKITNPENWPAKGQSKTYNKVWKVTINDELDVCTPKTAYIPLTLKDSTPGKAYVYAAAGTILEATNRTTTGYFSDRADTEREFYVYDGDAVPAAEDPTHTYYDFKGWAAEPVVDANGRYVYNAQWKIKSGVADKNKNNVADVEEAHVVTFYSEGKLLPEFTNDEVTYGTRPTAPSAEVMNGVNYAPDGKVFAGWKLEGSDNIGTVPVTGPARYDAVWQDAAPQDAVYITYWFYDWEEFGGDTTKAVLGDHYHRVAADAAFVLDKDGNRVKDDEGNDVVVYKATHFAPYTDNNYDDTIYLGWHELVNGEMVPYNHDKELTKAEAENLVLYRMWADDVNNNGEADGTAKDPYKKYIYRTYYDNYSPEEDAKIIWKYKSVNLNVLNPEYESFKPYEAEPARDSTKDDRKFLYWFEEVGSEAGDENSKTVTMVPVFGDDRNRNGALDSDEMVEVTENNPDAGVVSVNGKSVAKVTVYNGYLFDDRNNPVEDKLVGDGKLVKTSNGDAFLRNTKGSTTVKITPDDGYFVKSVKIGDVSQKLTFNADRSATFTIAASQKNVKEIVVEYGASKFELKNDTVDAGDIAALNGEIEAFVYEKLFSENGAYDPNPAYSNEYPETVQMKYLARAAIKEEDEVKVYVNDVKDALAPYEAVYSGLWNILSTAFGIDKDEGGYYYQIVLSERWEDINASFGHVKDPVAVVENYFAGLKTLSIEDLGEFATTLGAVEKLTALTNELEASAIHSFGFSAGTEQVKVSYEDDKLTIAENEKAYEITVTDDKRADATISGDDELTVTYGADILSNFSGNNLQMLVGNSDMNAGTYPIVLAAGGNKEYKPATKTVMVTVKPVEITVNVDSVDTTPNTEAEPNKVQTAMRNALKIGGTSNVSDIEMIQVIAGLDMTGFSVNMGKPIVADLKANAWIKIPESIAKIMDVLGYDVRTPRENWTLDKLYTVLTENQEVRNALEAIPQLNGKLDKILSALDKIRAWVGVDMDVYFGTDIYPENPGFYVNLAAVIDPNYEVTNPTNIGSFKGIDVYGNYALVHPFLTKPNQGIEFVLNNKAENVFAFNTPDEVKELKVVDAKGEEVKATVYYYGIDRTTGEVTLCGTEMPQTSGLYIASAVLLNQNQQMIGSDLAVVVIGVYDATVEVKKTIVVDDDKLHNPEIIVTNKKTGNPVNASLAVISGTVKESVSGELSINSFEGDVTFNIPERLGIWWNRFADEVNNNKYYDLPETVPYYSDVKVEAISVSAKYVKKFLEYCIDHVEQPADILAEYIGAEYVNMADQYITYAENQVLRVCNYLLKQVNRIDPKELPNVNVSLEFGHYINTEKNYKAYDENGIYLYLVMVADRDYMPAVGANFLVIQGAEDSLVLTNEMVPYDGEEHELKVTDTTNRDGFRFIIDRQNNTVNLLVDNDMIALANNLCEKVTGKEFSANNKTFTLAELMDAIEKEFDAYVKENQGKVEATITKAEYLAKQFADEMKAAIERKTGIDVVAVDVLMEKLGTTKEAALKVLENKVAAVLKDLEDMQAKDPYKDIPITINGKKPVDVGTYEFHAFSYNIVHAQGFLTIAPITIRVAANDAQKVYGGDEPVWETNARVMYYSYESVGLAEPVEVEVTGKLSEEIVNKLNLANYALVREEGENVGEYEIKFAGKPTFENPDKNFTDVVELATTIFTITPKKLTVEFEDFEKIYGESDPELTINKEIDGVTVNATLKRADEEEEEREQVGEHKLVIDTCTVSNEDGQDVTANYIINNGSVETGKVLKINPAKISVEVAHEVRVNDPMPDIIPAESYTVTIEGKHTDEQKAKLVEELNLQITCNGDTSKVGKSYNVNIDGYNASENYEVTISGTVTIVAGNYVCWNATAENGKYYTDLSDALADVDNDEAETIQMLADYEENYVMVAPGTTLDLNGKTVTARFVVGFNGSHVVDNSADNAGRLVAVMENVELAIDNSQIPIYAGTGYLFTDLVMFQEVYQNNGTKYVHLPTMEHEVVDQYLSDGGTDNNFNVIIRMDWTTDTATAYQNYVYYDETVSDVYGSWNDAESKYKRVFNADLANTKYLDFEISVILISGTGVEYKCN